MVAQIRFETVSGLVCLIDQQDRTGVQEPARFCHHEFHDGDDRIVRELFAEKVDGAMLPSLLFQFVGPPRRQDHHHRLWIGLPNVPQHFKPIHLRHAKVQHGNLRAMVTKELEGLAPVVRFEHLMAVATQDPMQQIAEGLIVIG